MSEDLPPPTVNRLDLEPRRLLVRLPNWVGDVVMAGPAVAAIRRACAPDTEIVGQAKPPLLALAALLPGLARVIPAGPDRGPSTLLASRRRLEGEAFDAAVTFPRGIRALLPAWLARIPVRVGFGGPWRRWPLTHPVEGWRPWRRAHRSRYFGLLARAFGAEVLPDPEPLAVPPPAATAVEDLLKGLGRRRDRPLVVLEPGAAYGPAKCWPAERFGGLAARLGAEGIDVLTVGTAAQHDREAVVSGLAPDLLRAAGRTPDLQALAGVLAAADLVVANDTGPMHVAAAVGTPVLALFGASDPVVSAPLGPGLRRILYEPEPCSPCFRRTCPVAGHPCLERFGVERVFREALQMLDAASAQV